MKLLDALKIGLDILAGFEYAKQLPSFSPHAINWTWKIGKWRLGLKGNLTAERID